MSQCNASSRVDTVIRYCLLAAAFAVVSGIAAAQGPAGGPGGPGGLPPGVSPPPPQVNHTVDCNSDCLRAAMERYLAAWAAHDPSSLQVTPTLRVSENGHAVALGDNVWKTIVKLGSQRIVFTDPFAGQVMALGTLEMRAHEPFIYSVRLKLEKNRISESETMVTSDKIAGQHFRPDLVGESVPLFGVLPAGERMSRAELLKAARVTWGIDPGSPLPQAPGCKHYENFESPDGASPCRGGPGRDARDRRIPLVDVEQGVVVKYQLEDFTDVQPRDPPPSERESKTPVFYYWPLTFVNLQVARISGGKLQTDEVFMNTQPHGLETVFRR